MKKWHFLFYLLLITFFSVGCAQQSTEVDYDVVISDGGHLVTFRENGDTLQKIKRIKRVVPEDLGFFNESTIDLEKDVYGLTRQWMPERPYLYHLDKTTLKLEAARDENDSYADYLTHDGQYLYGGAITTTALYFYKYNDEFETVKKLEVKNTNEVRALTHFLAIEDKLYATIHMVDKNTNTAKTELWMLNSDLEVEEKINLDVEDGVRRFGNEFVHGNGVLYISQWLDLEMNGDRKGGGKLIQTYNLKTREFGSIPLKYSYPERLLYDDENQILQVSHDSTQVADNLQTFIDLKTGQQRTVKIGHGDKLAYVTRHGNTYYYLFPDRLVTYQYNMDKRTEYSLKEFGIDEADILFFKD